LQDAVDVRAGALRARRGTPGLLDEAIALLLADAFTINHDRQAENANCVWFRQRLVAIDNGLAFVGLDNPGRRGDDLAQQTLLPTPLTRHVTLAALRGRQGHPAWDVVTRRLETWRDEAIEGLVAALPVELDRDHHTSANGLLGRLRRFLQARRGHARALKDAMLALVEAG
jgi:hypothetical protein